MGVQVHLKVQLVFQAPISGAEILLRSTDSCSLSGLMELCSLTWAKCIQASFSKDEVPRGCWAIGCGRVHGAAWYLVYWVNFSCFTVMGAVLQGSFQI